MARDDMTSDVVTASLASVKNIAVLMEADFDSGSIYLFTGYGTLTVDGVDYTGSGKMVQVDPAMESAGVQANGATVQLSGIQEADIAIALGEPYQGRPCFLKLAFFDSSNTLIDDPMTVFGGRMDVMNLVDDPAKGPVITMTAESEFIRMSSSRYRTRTHQDQQIDYPGDLGLEFVASMQDKTIYV